MNRPLWFLRLSCLVVTLAWSSSNVAAQTCPEGVIAEQRDATVFIHVQKTLKVTGAVEERFGTGFVVSPSGYVLTSKHVVEADDKVDNIEISGLIGSRKASSSVELRIVAKNDRDVALLKFEDTSKAYRYLTIGHP